MILPAMPHLTALARLVIPAPMMQPVNHILAHLFNHQTHHRGQAHTLICQLAGADKMPSLDLLVYQRTALKDDAL